MGLQRMGIQSVVVAGGPVSSLVILGPKDDDASHLGQLPIRIGRVEAMSISMGIDGTPHERPLTHDLMKSLIEGMGATLDDIVIHDVRGTTFYASVRLTCATGEQVAIDARPSDALALAVRTGRPIYVSDRVIEMACMPDFASVEREEAKHEQEAFHDFVEGLSPEDFEG